MSKLITAKVPLDQIDSNVVPLSDSCCTIRKSLISHLDVLTANRAAIIGNRSREKFERSLRSGGARVWLSLVSGAARR